MTTVKPNRNRVYVTLTDPVSRKSRAFVLYETTIADLCKRFGVPAERRSAKANSSKAASAA